MPLTAFAGIDRIETRFKVCADDRFRRNRQNRVMFSNNVPSDVGCDHVADGGRTEGEQNEEQLASIFGEKIFTSTNVSQDRVGISKLKLCRFGRVCFQRKTKNRNSAESAEFHILGILFVNTLTV